MMALITHGSASTVLNAFVASVLIGQSPIHPAYRRTVARLIVAFFVPVFSVGRPRPT
jgi:hypothetical protein